MGFIQIVGGGLAIVFTVAVVGGGCKGCLTEPDPKPDSSLTGKFTYYAVDTAGDIVSSSGQAVKDAAADPDNQQAIREGTKGVLDFLYDTAGSILSGVNDFLEEKNKQNDPYPLPKIPNI